MVDLNDYFIVIEKEMMETVTRGTIEKCCEFISKQQQYIRSLVNENEKLREYILDQIINKEPDIFGFKKR